MEITKNDLSVVYYTCNHLERTNPYFVTNTKKQLLKAIDDLPLIIVSHFPMEKDDILMQRENTTNIVVGDLGRHHLNIYKQILIGSKAAKTKWVAMAEDDIFYSYEHFHTYLPPHNKFAYDMMKVSLFTWTRPPVYSFRTKRRVVNHLIAKRDMLVSAMEERFRRVDELKAQGVPEEQILSKFGDPGRYEELLGVTKRESEEFYTTCPGIVLTHPDAYGYLNHGKKKRLGDLRIVELQYWGKAEDMLKLWNKDWENYVHN
jgi:hypothetical protein